jgi:hypothetical protein
MLTLRENIKCCPDISIHSFNAVTLSGFFCLRFLTASLTVSVGLPVPAQGQAGPSVNLAHFSQLLQMSLSLQSFSGNNATYVRLNHHLIGRVFSALLCFTFGLADLTEPPHYAVPGDHAVRRAVGVVADIMAANYDRVMRRSERLAGNTQERQLVMWALGTFLMSFFKDNIAD